MLKIRDLDLMAELDKLNPLHVAVTINSRREEVRKKMKPRTATASTRLRQFNMAVKKFMPTGPAPGLRTDLFER